MERLLILDGNSLLNRAYYALPLMSTSEGIHTNAIYGFSNMLFKMREELNPNYIVTTFDKKAPTFRHKEYSDYKAGRKKMPPELAEQFPLVKELLNKMDIDIFEIDGFEADDLIGTLAVHAEKQGIEVYIITGDKDALQLASENIKVVITKKGITEKEIYDGNRMVEEFGVTSRQFIDVKGLMGDASDNIPGVPGIGEKTAFKLIKEYGSIENLLENIDSLKGKVKENLLNHSEDAVFSKRLATIITDVPVEIDINSIKSSDKYDIQGLREFFQKLQFKSLLEKLPKDESYQEEKINLEIVQVKNPEQLNELLGSLADEIFINYEVTGTELLSKLALNKIDILNNDKIYSIDLEKIEISALVDLFKSESKKIIHNGKLLLNYLSKHCVQIENFTFDTEIAAYLIDSSKGKYPLKELVEDNFFVQLDNENKLVAFSYLPKLYKVQFDKIKELNMENLFYNLEMPLVKILSSMEVEGFKINIDTLTGLGDNFKIEIDKVQKEIYDLSEEEFNISSPKQLGKILFEKLDLPVIKKTKTGYSTNAEVLEKLSDKHPIIDKIMFYRQVTKLHSTYIEGLKNVIDVDSKIHSSFNQTVTTTGRLSSTEPNLQNIPIKTEMGRAIRRVFEPTCEECKILSADYSQIELRVLAHISEDENLISAFVEHDDIHTKTASEVFGVSLENVTSQMRSAAKAVNFGIVYGISDFALSEDLKISKKEAKEYIDIYFDRYPKVKEYIKNVIKVAENQGIVSTILNRRRFIPEIKASNKIVKALGDRLAMNAPIQGSAADIIKIAMVNVYNRLNAEKCKSTLILQVHDEIIINVFKDEIEVVSKIVKEEMENVLTLKVPLEVDVKIGDTWYEAK
ncbi:MAG: DNA polymerase I [Clostridiaceae bacterium]